MKSATATVTVEILDANNKAPSFIEQLYVFQINEDARKLSALAWKHPNFVYNDTR